MQYVLITFYNRGTMENQVWDVYGHRAPHDNDCIASFGNEQDAMFEAHGYMLPVMKGVSNSMQIAPMIRLLSA